MTTAEIIMASCAASGPITGVIWYFADKRTRKIVADEIGTLIDIKLATFKEQLNSPKGYRRSESCDLIMKPVVAALEKVEEELHELRGRPQQHLHRLDPQSAGD